jgi:hypothetical protein
MYIQVLVVLVCNLLVLCVLVLVVQSSIVVPLIQPVLQGKRSELPALGLMQVLVCYQPLTLLFAQGQ